MAKIITISGSAQHGKDTFASFLSKALESRGKKTLVIHYADVLKFVAKQWYGWDGVKDDKGRTLLQYLGTDVFRKNRPDCWVTIVKELILGMGDTIDFVLIPDCRFPNEIEVVKEINPDDFMCIKVFRPNFDNGLSEEQKNHKSETALNGFNFDLRIINDAGVEGLTRKAEEVSEAMINGWSNDSRLRGEF